jgi:hypothetical protein
MPSFVVMTLMLALANAVLFDRKVYNWLALPCLRRVVEKPISC